MARIPYPDPASQSPELKDLLHRIGSLNLTRMMSHAPAVMRPFARLGAAVLHETSLDPIVRELVVLRIGQMCESAYEQHHHESVARKIGMDEATFAAIMAQNLAALTPPQRIAVQIAEQMKNDGCVSASLLASARAHYSSAQLIELTVLAGYYIATAAFLRTFDIEIEEYAPALGAHFNR